MTALWPLWISALGLMLLTLGGLLWPLLRESAESAEDGASAHERLRQIYQVQLTELELEHQRKSLSNYDYAQAVDELKGRLLEELNGNIPATAVPVNESVWRRRVPAALLSALLPATAFVLYVQVGDPRAAATVTMPPSDTHASTGIDVVEMVRRLELRLSEAPNNLEGWIVLARSREVMEDFAGATLAYQRALTLARQQNTAPTLQARLYADMADALASAHEGRLDREVQAALSAALALDAAQPKALALAGSAALREGDVDGARQYWQRLLALLEPESDIALRVQNDLARLDHAAQDRQPIGSQPVAGLAGTVQLSPAMQAQVAPEDTVFIVARAAQAGRMPVAVLRLAATQLPAQFTMDDSNAMSPDLPLSRFREFTLEAHISHSGTAQRLPGQPSSLPQKVQRGAIGVTLLIDSVGP